MSLAAMVCCCNENMETDPVVFQPFNREQTTFFNRVLNKHENLNFKTKSLFQSVTHNLGRQHITLENNG